MKIYISSLVALISIPIAVWFLFNDQILRAGILVMIVGTINTFLVGWQFTELVLLIGALVIAIFLRYLFFAGVLATFIAIIALLDLILAIRLNREIKKDGYELNSFEFRKRFKEKEVLHNSILKLWRLIRGRL